MYVNFYTIPMSEKTDQIIYTDVEVSGGSCSGVKSNRTVTMRRWVSLCMLPYIQIRKGHWLEKRIWIFTTRLLFQTANYCRLFWSCSVYVFIRYHQCDSLWCWV